MQLEEVPQDKHLFGQYQELVYAKDSEGNLLPVKSAGWNVKSLANSQYWSELQQLVLKEKDAVRARRVSPISFYMTLHQLDVSMLAKYTKLSKWSVRKHLKPKHFEKLDATLLARYASVFKITPEQLQKYAIEECAARHTALWAAKYNQDTENEV